MRINKNSLIPYISIFISVFFYYAEMAHQLFFNIFSHATNTIVLFEHINIISHYYLVYLIVITPIFVFFNGKMNLLYKCLFYFIFPYFLSLFAWYTHIYFYLPQNSNLGNGTLLGEFGYITVTIYIIYGSFLIPLVACLCEIFIRLLYRYLYRFY